MRWERRSGKLVAAEELLTEITAGMKRPIFSESVWGWRGTCVRRER